MEPREAEVVPHEDVSIQYMHFKRMFVVCASLKTLYKWVFGAIHMPFFIWKLNTSGIPSLSYDSCTSTDDDFGNRNGDYVMLIFKLV